MKIFENRTGGHLQTMWTAEGGGGVPKMSMFVHMGEGGSRPLSMWIMIPIFLLLISGICE